MGSYLSQPVTTKETEVGAGSGLEWVSTSMQGWRTGMEDAHIAKTNVDCGGAQYSVFGVFDGHGGREVANFCKAHVPVFLDGQLRALHKSEDSPDGIRVDVIAEALVKTYNGMDEMLRRPESEEELLSYRKKRGFPQEGAEDAGGEGRDGAAANRNMSPQMQMVQDRLQAAVSADMQRAQERGALTSQEAMRIAMGMSFLQRLEGSAERPTAASADGAGPAFSAGCTAVCVIITDTHVVCANAGDSRAVLCRGGRAVPLSRDHKPNDRLERRRVLAAGGMVKEINTPGVNGRTGRVQYRVNGDLNLSRAIGDLRHKTRPDLRHDQQAITSTPDVHYEVREPDDEFVVLACDGVWDVRSNKQVCDEVREGIRDGRSLQDIGETILDACLCQDPKAAQGMGADNMTLVIAKMEGTIAVNSATPPRKLALCLPFRCLR